MGFPHSHASGNPARSGVSESSEDLRWRGLRPFLVKSRGPQDRRCELPAHFTFVLWAFPDSSALLISASKVFICSRQNSRFGVTRSLLKVPLVGPGDFSAYASFAFLRLRSRFSAPKCAARFCRSVDMNHPSLFSEISSGTARRGRQIRSVLSNVCDAGG